MGATQERRFAQGQRIDQASQLTRAHHHAAKERPIERNEIVISISVIPTRVEEILLLFLISGANDAQNLEMSRLRST